MTGASRRSLILWSLSALAAIAMTTLLSTPPNLLGGLREHYYDLLQRVVEVQRERSPVVIVAIDDASISQYGRWPWSRIQVADLLEEVLAHNPAAVGFDVIFPEEEVPIVDQILDLYPQLDDEERLALGVLPKPDQVLREGVEGHRVVLARVLLRDPAEEPATGSIHRPTVLVSQDTTVDLLQPYKSVLTNIPTLEQAAAGHGFVNGIVDSDGTIRRAQLVIAGPETLEFSLPLELLRVATGASAYMIDGTRTGPSAITVGRVTIPIAADGSIRPHFAGTYIPRVSAASLFGDKPLPLELEGRIVLIGVTALGLVDKVSSPIEALVDGVEIQAQIIDTLVYDRQLHRPAWAWMAETTFAVVAHLVITLLILRRYPLIALSVMATTLALATAGSMVAFDIHRILLDAASVSASIVSSFLVLAVVSGVHAEVERRGLTRALRLAELEAAKRDGELAAASRIQNSMNPNPLVLLHDSIEAYGRLLPAKEVSGDFYDIRCVDDQHIFFVVGDVSGKGIPAALFMAIARAFSRSLSRLSLKENLVSYFGRINSALVENNPDDMFVTAVFGLLNMESGHLEYGCCGHSPPILLPRAGGAVQLPIVGGPPLSVIDGFPYEMGSMTLERGAILITFTDGVTENPLDNNEPLGDEGLVEVLSTFEPSDGVSDIVDRLIEIVSKPSREGGEVFDDITVLGIRLRVSTPE